MFLEYGINRGVPKPNEIGLYVHVPFCASKCRYCDFNSFEGKDSYIPAYFEALKKEALYYGGILDNCRINTIFIGGGTPSLVPASYICKLIDVVAGAFHIDERAEVSIEANPGTLSYDKLTMYKNAGINRLSLGLQAWQEEILKLLGRIHTAADFEKSFEAARQAGFMNINVDLMFGVPGQTLDNWAESIHKTVSLGVEHISCYSLKIEENTVFENWLESGKIVLPDEELDRMMYHYAIEKLKTYGYKHYEISNFAKPERECRHNLACWKAKEYLGLGAGAHSYVNGNRYHNSYSIESYISFLSKNLMPREDTYPIDKKEEMKEFMLLGLRLTSGVSCKEFRSRFGCEVKSVFAGEIARLLNRQLIEADDNGVRLTTIGLDMANQVFMEFV